MYYRISANRLVWAGGENQLHNTYACLSTEKRIKIAVLILLHTDKILRPDTDMDLETPTTVK